MLEKNEIENRIINIIISLMDLQDGSFKRDELAKSFRLGFDSLLTMRFMVQVEDEFNIELDEYLSTELLQNINLLIDCIYNIIERRDSMDIVVPYAKAP